MPLCKVDNAGVPSRFLMLSILLVFECVCSVGCNSTTVDKIDGKKADSVSSKMQALVGENQEIIRASENVQIKRIETIHDPSGPTEKALTDFGPVNGNDLLSLQKLLLDESSYGWEYAKPCETSPGFLIVFTQGTEKVEVRLCFECLMIGFTPGQWEDFDPVADALLTWVKKIYPDDSDVESLKISESHLSEKQKSEHVPFDDSRN